MLVVTVTSVSRQKESEVLRLFAEGFLVTEIAKS